MAPDGGRYHAVCWEAVCGHCSKPVRFGTGITLQTGERVHLRCLARDTTLSALERQERARLTREAAARRAAQAARLVEQSRALRACAVCQWPLAGHGGLLFQGDRLVHAACWHHAAAETEPA